MKLLPTCTFNFTPSSLFLFLFERLLRFSRGAAQVLSLFFLLLLLPFPLLFLNLLNECSPCIASSPSYNWVHILLVLDPLCVVIVYSLMAARCLSFDEPFPSTRRRIPRHVLSTEILKKLPLNLVYPTSFENVVLQSPSSRARWKSRRKLNFVF